MTGVQSCALPILRMANGNFSTQAWQSEPTESMWSILKRFIALDRPNQNQCIAATGRALEPVGASQWLLYRDVDEIYRYRRIQQALGLTECQTRMATLPLLATLPENNMAIRYCRLCMEKIGRASCRERVCQYV